VGQMPMVGVNGSNGVQPVSMNMSITQKGQNGTAAAVSGPGGGRASGYGY
jgi:ATF/CREB family transcription factor